MPPLFGYEGNGKFWGEPDDDDPWESNPYGIRVMSPEEDAAWARFEDYMTQKYGYGWSITLDMTPTPKQRKAAEMMRKMGKAFAEQQVEFAIRCLTGED